ncbi:MAG TPA: hypothetical protein VEG60_10535 [Candidatus Binatia bacterium]|nr:hypothetical protein [Candidatus Binatia bacterium]
MPTRTAVNSLFRTSKLKSDFINVLRRSTAWSRRNVPWGLRSVLGVVFLVLGVFGFLPVIGFWMIPVGVALIALDIPPWRRRLRRWLRERSKQKD